MAKAKTAEKSELTPEERAELIRNTPRQSPLRFAQYFVIISEAAPERVDELFGSQVDVLTEVVAEHGDKVGNPINDAIEKATAAQVEIAVKALKNDSPLTGYADYVFDEEKFAEKTREKKARVKKSAVDKVEDVLSTASPEDLAALAELMKARGITV